jgi:PadR family transcriptional regulator, regulatory protein PadR
MELRGHLDLLLLAILARTGPAHGYALISALRDGSDGTFDLPEGTVYPALHRLERTGQVASRWSEDAPRRRRVYELTAAGHTALAARRQEWHAFARAVDRVARPSPLAATRWALLAAPCSLRSPQLAVGGTA